MSIVERIKSNPKLKQLVLNLMMPKNQSRPRLWVKLFLNPFKHKKGKNSRICRYTRMDVMPFNNFELGNDSTIEDFCTINNGVGDVLIGDRTRIGMSNVLIGPVTIGNDVMFAQNIVLSGLNHGYEDITITPHKQPVTKNKITIEDEVWIGANSVIVAGVTIGKHSVIAAGSIVTKDIPPFSVAAGNPAKVIKQYNLETGIWERVTIKA
ncbi:MAG: acyltransferase [Mariniphaga sp.]|nr:acyltransferase [Mariniphaga sp.]